MDSTMKVMIIGATGFIGKSLKEYLQEKQTLQIVAPTRIELNLLARDDCHKFISRVEPDCIIHCAVNVNSVDETLRAYYNVASTYKNFGRLIYLGSGAEYNPSRYIPLMTEEYSKNSFPSEGYPLGKWVIGNDIENNGLEKLVNLRLFGIYGNYEDFSRRFISNNICRVLSGLPISMNKDMNFDYLFVRDLCVFIEKIMSQPVIKQKTYNVCTGKPIKLTELANIIRDLMNVIEPIKIKAEGQNNEYSGDPSRAIAEFGPIILTSPLEAIKTMVPYFEKMFQNDSKFKMKFIGK